MPAWMDDDLERRRRAGLYRIRRRLQSGQGATVRHRRRGSASTSPRTTTSTSPATRAWPAPPPAPPVATAAARGPRRWSPACCRRCAGLERDLAAWEGTEAALVFTSGFQANLAVVSSLAGAGDAVFSDAANHASLIDGCRLCRRGRPRLPPHRPRPPRRPAPRAGRRRPAADHRQRQRLQHGRRPAPTWPDYCGLLANMTPCCCSTRPTPPAFWANRPGADRPLSASDAHDDRLIKVGTLSKALGSQGGFVCGSRRLIDWLVNHARPYIFSTALAPPPAAAARRAVALVGRGTGAPPARARLAEACGTADARWA